MRWDWNRLSGFLMIQSAIQRARRVLNLGKERPRRVKLGGSGSGPAALMDGCAFSSHAAERED